MKKNKLAIAGFVGCFAAAAFTGIAIQASTPIQESAPTGSAASIQLPASVAAEIDKADGLYPCSTEDSTNCFWDATTRGNGAGKSFIEWNGTYYYAH